MTKKYAISFVIPVYRSEKTIKSVIADIAQIADLDWEIILINDNSPDNVDLVIKEIIKEYPKNIIYLSLPHNGGQQAAIITGLGYTTKEYVATIDDDGQNPAVEILKLLAKLNADDLDLVYGEFRQKKHGFFRKLISKINNRISKYTIGNKKGIPISNVRLMRNYLAKAMAENSSQYSYIEGLAFMLTDRIGSTKIEHKERLAGKSGYNLMKLISLWSNHAIGYSNIILRLISLVSLAISILAFLVGVGYFIVTLNNIDRPSGWLSTYLTITMLFSFMFLIISILTEYIGRIYSKMNQTNTKIVRKVHP